MRAVRRRVGGFGAALALIMVAALVLRLWGSRTGLPYVFNVDEGAHFVPRAIGMFDHSYDPGYFINPPAMTYLFHVVFWLRWGGDGVREQFSANPTAVFELARWTVAVLAAVSVGLLAWAAARLFDRRVALVAAALLAFSYLPAFYGHFALNDAALVAPVCLALAGAAGILRTGRTRDYLIAGLGLGLACATKYTAGIVLAPILAAAILGSGPGGRHRRDLLLCFVLAGGAFLALNPYALFSFHAFRVGLHEQSAASTDGGGKLGLADTRAVTYYLSTLLWGLGVVPVLAAIGGAVRLFARDRGVFWLLVPAPLLFLAFMGLQDRFFARWLMPIYPFLILLAAWAGVQAFAWLAARVRGGRLPAWSPAVAAALVLCGQGLVYVVHDDAVLTRTDTRVIARRWMVANIPEGAKIVLEPIAPDTFVYDAGHPSKLTRSGDRWSKRAGSHFRITPEGKKALIRDTIKLEDYERTLRPDLIGSYTRGGYCWVITGSILYGRPAVTPKRAPYALRYYAALAQAGDVVYTTSPLAEGADEPPFSFDDSYDYRPLGYRRPGPRIVIYRLHGDRCP